eukprot:TRINITY_DN12959_c0_g1_i1.p1 TRINITY_DN12959_c0_g1~~TRINITY_DN12959_c0_g1_i1.p1  ORF type:complete len:380 (+),score=129.18 TRINITY_DN12959_c0_g1_i1:146-1285(+)
MVRKLSYTVFIEVDGSDSHSAPIVVPCEADWSVSDAISEVKRKLRRHQTLKNVALDVRELQLKDTGAWLDPEDTLRDVAPEAKALLAKCKPSGPEARTAAARLLNSIRPAPAAAPAARKPAAAAPEPTTLTVTARGKRSADGREPIFSERRIKFPRSTSGPAAAASTIRRAAMDIEEDDEDDDDLDDDDDQEMDDADEDDDDENEDEDEDLDDDDGTGDIERFDGGGGRRDDYTWTGTNTIYVKNIAYDVTDLQLRRRFESVGPVVRAVMLLMGDGTRKGDALVEFENGRDVARAIRQLHGVMFHKRDLVVERSRLPPRGSSLLKPKPVRDAQKPRARTDRADDAPESKESRLASLERRLNSALGSGSSKPPGSGSKRR